jgi:hypothetical protein
VRGYAGGARLNTDDNALIEFSSPRDLVAYAISDADEAAGHVPQADLRGLAARVLKNAPPSFGDEVAFSLMRAGRFPEAGRIAFAPSGSPAGGSGAGAVLRLLAGSERAFPYETAGRDATGERWETLVGVLARHDWAGAAKFVSLLPDPPGGADARAFFAGYLLHMARDDEGARSVLEPLASGPAAARYPAVIYFLARTRLSLGDSAGAVDAMRSYVLQAAAATDPSAPEGGGI